ncbi:5-methyltetrahydropteroyltriglutamate--homocysteine methyltransferase [Alkalihalobacillus alcalophilus ATCC 27647 = CGMCC 1.3604]|uniref:5-methyltetrahydropteroyltriglutamate--homocysteine methyltransferase n=1 Tax=Alkalihalobacillus alcalophilus ATCC 27647 = CGMCC 1.3604 TaxID=1218173 RepID=A0A094WIZ8_ALKAL|nr:5-methyltetrahydropteroyltriglutamate--homocysteine S-methyltransferase [Alkalihalobacillus alcalophilus]KGA96796.1 5-methyltetrahydropteroyltriglutamate--homocysteine methyltransferase [Alkalihalobacillus alcalophilus ATCC 27647 = CGMCC 1.3604]MED1561365.1 5-methyltetrahydropteroyltriglutamate--homocysteine S-methyltransferase [Alkalihalobacillus alcalophilus]THG92418.1 5-methyltetrahydropteroyltriglutamate--homocysteine methyltransferase [Alkalihalobacillus alcalophilus ATCC 27647 = CGMCC 1
MGEIRTSNLGYPRIGEKREWKKLLEAYWAGNVTEDDFFKTMKEYRLLGLKKQKEAGIDLIPVGDFSFYDHVLDHSTMFGLVPNRFDQVGEANRLETYFAIARGTKEAPASEMTKWFNTNYHYIVPELEDKKPKLVHNKPLEAYLEAKEELGIEGKPVLLGPFTFLKLSKGYQSNDFEQHLNDFIPIYIEILQQLEQAGVKWVQIDEPSLVKTLTNEEIRLFTSTYHKLKEAVPQLQVILQTYFDAVSFYEEIISLPVEAIGLDFVHGYDENIASLKEFGFPADKYLALGIIDGRNIWKENLQNIDKKLTEVTTVVPLEQLILQPSSSLLHVPVTLKHETKLDSLVLSALAFSDEKLVELSTVKHFATANAEEKAVVLEKNNQLFKQISSSDWRRNGVSESSERKTKRATSVKERQKVQNEKFQLPLLPTTTIGSFPQTKEVRKSRNLWRKGELTNEAYTTFVQEQIKKWIKIQEDLELDVFVHGEFERNDMVEFFGEKLGGFVFTQNGWVQSYGSRCVKPPVIFGDVQFLEEMTVAETVYAQSLTEKRVKGMLTGPVTILNWSFVRNDLTRQEVAYQIAEALIEEVEALEAAGIEMIQVDEPAIREGLPLKEKDWATYLNWAVEAFRISTATVKDSTQIHTHMCYSDFRTIIHSISDLDADVISIETSRSAGEIISTFETNVYDKGIGLGVYDIHSPRVPSVNEMTKVIERALEVLPQELFWVNPDCGLKTRGEEETVAALKNMVEAAKEIRVKSEATQLS